MLVMNIGPMAQSIRGGLAAEIGRQQVLQSCGAVPLQADQIVAYRMEVPLVGMNVDRLVHDVLAQLLQPEMLQPLLYDAHIDVGHRSRRETTLALERLHQ